MTYELDPVSQRIVDSTKAEVEQQTRDNLLKPFDMKSAVDRKIVVQGLKEGFQASKELEKVSRQLTTLNNKIATFDNDFRKLVFRSIKSINIQYRHLGGIIIFQELYLKKIDKLKYTLEDCKAQYQQFVHDINSDGSRGVKDICNYYWQSISSVEEHLSPNEEDSFNTGRVFSRFSGGMVNYGEGQTRRKMLAKPIEGLSEKQFESMKAIIIKQICVLGIQSIQSSFYVKLKELRIKRNNKHAEYFLIRNRDIKSNASKQELDVKW